MITVHLTNATNGIIKKVIDTQYNGVDQTIELTSVYELNEEDRLDYFIRTIDLFEDLCEDLGLELGGDYDPATLGFELEWGDKYLPEEKEIDQKIKYLRSKIKELQNLKKIIKQSGNNE
jgi:hypothetical protein